MKYNHTRNTNTGQHSKPQARAYARVEQKTGVAVQMKKLPAAPPVYRPQPAPRCLQLKSAQPQRNAPIQMKAAAPAAPSAGKQRSSVLPAGRPAPQVVQKSTPHSLANSAVKRIPASPPPATRPKGTVQRFAWAIHDSRDMRHSEVVDQNLVRAQSRYTHTETTTDPDKDDEPRRVRLNEGEAIHLHAHGHEEAVAGFSAGSLARELQRKFDLEDLAGRSIVLHSCKTGQAEFGKDLLDMLLAYAAIEQVNLTGTRVYAPVHYLVVEKDGYSYVAKEGVDDSQLRSEQRKDKLRKLGEGWRGWVITRYGTITEIHGAGVDVAGVMDMREGAKPDKYKPKKVKEVRRSYGYYDDPRRKLKDHEEDLISRAIKDGQYPPKKKK